MNVSQLVDAHTLQLRADGRSPHTILQFQRHGLLFARWLAAEGVTDDVATFEPPTIARFLSSPFATRRPDGKPKLPSTVNTIRISVRCLLRFAHDSGYAPHHAGRLIRAARSTPPPPRAMPAADIAKLLDTLAAAKGRAAERDHMLFALLAATGIRIGSAVALTVEDVDIEDGSMRIRTAKGNVRGVVYLAAPIRDHLQQFVGDRHSGFLFPGRCGDPLCARHVQHRMAMWLERAGVHRKSSPHRLRHAYASTLLDRCGNLAIVQAALLHASIVSTTRYAKVDEARLRAAVSG